MPTINAQTSRLHTTCLLIIATIGAGFALTYARTVLIPFVLAIFISYIVCPVVDLLQTKTKAPRWLALVGALSLCLILALFIALLITSNIRSVVEGAEIYRERVVELLHSATDLAVKFGVDVDRDSIITAVRKFPIFGVVGGLAGKLIDFFSTGMLTLIFLMFVLTGQSQIHRKGMYLEIDQKIRKYLITKVITSGVTGILVGTILAVLGVELSFLFGFLAFMLNFIPTLGSIVATIAPLPILLISAPGWGTVIAALILPSGVQFVVGNIVEPRLMGQSLDLHPATILLSLMFWGMIWGTIGMILSVPITATLKIIFERIESTRPITELMAGRLPSAG